MAQDDFDFEKGEDGPGNTELVYETKFKGRPVLTMKRHPDDKYPFTVGLGKARLIIENYEAIEAFTKKHSREDD